MKKKLKKRVWKKETGTGRLSALVTEFVTKSEYVDW